LFYRLFISEGFWLLRLICPEIQAEVATAAATNTAIVLIAAKKDCY
jgi:hypothetical protein